MSQNQENQASQGNQENQENQANKWSQGAEIFTFSQKEVEQAVNIFNFFSGKIDRKEWLRIEVEIAVREKAEKERAEKERIEKENLVFGAGKSLFEVSNLHWAADSFKKYFIGENILECPRFCDDPKDFNIQKIQKVNGNFIVLIDPKYIQGRKTVSGFLYQITQKNGTFLLVFSVSIDHLKTVGKEYFRVDQIVKIENVSSCIYVI